MKKEESIDTKQDGKGGENKQMNNALNQLTTQVIGQQMYSGVDRNQPNSAEISDPAARKFSMMSFADGPLIQTDLRRPSVGKKMSGQKLTDTQANFQVDSDKNHLHFDVGNNHMKLISAAALQQKTRQFSVHYNASDKYTIELKESLKNIRAQNAKQAN